MRIVIIIISTLVTAFIGLIIGITTGMNIGGNYFTNFVFNGARGYEATGQIGAMVGTILFGFIGFYLPFKFLKRRK